MAVPEPPWKRRSPQDKARAQEQRIGNLPGASRQPSSGRIWSRPRDNIVGDYLVEARTTDSGSYRIEEKEFLDIQQRAATFPPGCRPAMMIQFPNLRLFVKREEDELAMKMRLAFLEELHGEA